jgi:hypothetical protein
MKKQCFGNLTKQHSVVAFKGVAIAQISPKTCSNSSQISQMFLRLDCFFTDCVLKIELCCFGFDENLRVLMKRDPMKN